MQYISLPGFVITSSWYFLHVVPYLPLLNPHPRRTVMNLPIVLAAEIRTPDLKSISLLPFPTNQISQSHHISKDTIYRRP